MIGDITQIKRMLAERAQSAAEYLLPRGKRSGGEWRVGSAQGEPGQSLGVHLTGSKAGIWSDFNEGSGGDLLDLWAATKGIPLGAALDDARAWLGVSRQEPDRPMDRDYKTPPKPKCKPPAAHVRDYLEEDRNLPPASIEAYRIGENSREMFFPFVRPNGDLAMVKVREAADGARPKPTSAGCMPSLFGWQAIPDDNREIVITEGELDAVSFHAFGFPAVSVPFGGGAGKKQDWIENEFENLDRFERIYLALDMDEPGEKAAGEIAKRLGRHRCYRVKLPRKDANQCLVDGVGSEVIRECITQAQALDPDGLRQPTAFATGVTDLFWPREGQEPGYRMPYAKIGSKMLFRPSELTLWSGASGAGKSQILSDCVVDWIDQGSRICLSSLEMKAVQTLKRMVKQTVGVDRPTEESIVKSLKWMDHGLLLYEHVGKQGVAGILEVFDFARAKYGCDQFVIDSLMRLGIASDDYNGQEQALYKLVDWTIASEVHLHLVAHARKGGKDQGVPQTEDIKGAMEVGANAFNIVTVWRNRSHEDLIQKAPTPEEKQALEEKPGVLLNIAKQRNGDFEGKVGLWFDQDTYRYRSSQDQQNWERTYIREFERSAA